MKITTISGVQFDILRPRPEDVRIADIAWSLARVCRFGGHVRAFYSVAQHSVHVSELVPAELAMAGLLHDAAEAYVGDLVAPIKRRMPEYSLAEDRVLVAIHEALGVELPGEDAARAIEEADLLMRAAEMRDLTGIPFEDAPEDVREVVRRCETRETVEPVTDSTWAYVMFMERFSVLGGDCGPGMPEGLLVTSQDLARDFVRDVCVVGDGESCGQHDLRTRYYQWLRLRGCSHVSVKQLRAYLVARCGVRGAWSYEQGYTFKGIGIRPGGQSESGRAA